MGSPISPVAACLFMETLERDYFLRIMGRNSHWLRYIDDVLIITPNSTNMENKLRMINNVNINIQFTLESETNQELPFLDVRIIRTIENLQFKVYRKQTNKEDYIHYYSGHNQRIKTGVLIGFFLRAYRVCSSIYLEEELNHIIDMFSKLKYPLWTILKCKHKAKNIRERNKVNHEDNRRTLIVPNSQQGELISKYLQKANLNIIITTGQKISDLTRKTNQKDINENSVVYKIPCSGCDHSYYGETGCGIQKRMST